MGYCMEQRKTRFVIRREHHEAALAAVKALADRLPKYPPSRTWHYAFVDTEQFITANTLQDALRPWRWKARVSPEDGSITHVEFTGEKLGNEEILFSVIAPYVKAGSFIQMVGEDARHWRWLFDGRNVYRLAGRVSFDEPSEANRVRSERLHASGWGTPRDDLNGD